MLHDKIDQLISTVTKFCKHLSHGLPVVKSPVNRLIMCNLDGCRIVCIATAVGVGPNTYRRAGAILYPVRCITSPRFGKNLLLFLAQHVYCCDRKFRESSADVQIEAYSR